MSMPDYSRSFVPTKWKCLDDDVLETDLGPNEKVTVIKWPDHSSEFGDRQTTVIFEDDIRSVTVTEIKIVEVGSIKNWSC